MKRKMMALLLSMTLGATMLAGCGSGSSDSGDSSAKDTKEDAAADETDKEEADAADETEASGEKTDVYVFIAASLKNTMEEIKANYEAEHPNVNIIYNADSSGTLQTQIEEGAQCDIFFSAATKQMDALTEEGYVIDGSVKKQQLPDLIILQRLPALHLQVKMFRLDSMQENYLKISEILMM